MKIYWNYARISKNWEGFDSIAQNRSLGVGIVGNWVVNFRKNGVGWGDYNYGRETGSVRQGFVQLIYKLAATNFENLR